MRLSTFRKALFSVGAVKQPDLPKIMQKGRGLCLQVCCLCYSSWLLPQELGTVPFPLLLVASRNSKGQGQLSVQLYSTWVGGVGMTY